MRNKKHPHAVKYLEAEAHHCPYPLWGDNDPLDKKYVCGAAISEGRPYCSEHVSLCYSGKKPKKLTPPNERGFSLKYLSKTRRESCTT